jgi:hypothetical protein
MGVEYGGPKFQVDFQDRDWDNLYFEDGDVVDEEEV